jgi:hypothetical protein
MHSLRELRNLLSKGKYEQVIIYGHAVTYSNKAGGWQEILLADNRASVSPQEWAHALMEAGIRQTIVAGCASQAFAAGVHAAAPSIRAGGLPHDRYDNIAGNEKAVTFFKIEPQPLRWWPR